jgi:hypothetical protein
VRQKYGVTGAAFLEAATHTLHLDREAAIAQTLLELSIIPGGPYG